MENTKIIIVEDEYIIAKDIEKTLEFLGYDVLMIYSSGEEFLKNVKDCLPDLVIMDILLAGNLTGIETAAKLNKERSIPVIFLTAHAEKERIEEAKKAGTYGYLIKPYKDKELETTIEITLYKHDIFQKLQESEKRYKTILENSHNGIIITDLDGIIIFYNEKVKIIFPKHFQIENKTDNIRNIFTNDNWLEFYNNLLIDKKSTITSIVDIPTENNQLQKIETTVNIINVDKEINIVFQIKDLTDQYNSYRHMKMLTTVMRSVDECLYITDENNIIIYINNTFQKKLGYSFEELYGSDIFNSIYNKIPTQKLDEIKNKISDGNWSGEIDLLSKNEKLSPYFVTLSLINDDKDYIVGILRDITKEQNLKKQVDQVQRLESIGKLAGGIAHDFNNLLSIINGYSELMLSKLGQDFIFYDFLKEIHGAGVRASNLTRQLLLFSKKESGDVEKFNQNDVITSVTKMLRRVIGENISLQLDLDEELFYISIDRGQFEQILMNLVVNARDALNQTKKTGKEILIKTDNIYFDEVFVDQHVDSKIGYYTKLTVSDNGVGILKEVQDKIFDPFFSTKGIEDGTGLGLSTVYGIVKKFNGIITLHSEIGIGTEFHIYLPRCNEKFTRRSLLQNKIQKGKGTILIVEDSKPLLRVSKEMIKTLGYTALCAETANEAFEIGKRFGNKIDLLFADLILSEYDGEMVYNELLKYNPLLKVLYTSGYDDNFLKTCNIKISKKYFVRKPFDRKIISQKLSELLES